jgi:hypothetical protein
MCGSSAGMGGWRWRPDRPGVRRRPHVSDTIFRLEKACTKLGLKTRVMNPLNLLWRLWIMNNTAVNVNSFIEIRRIGFDVLKNTLGPVGVTRFIQQFENGSGDYTKEKYSQPDLTREELDILLKNERK